MKSVEQYIIYIYQVKEITKRVYNNLMNLINLKNRMDTIFMNSENNKTSEPHRLLLNLADKMNLKRSDKCVALSNLSMHYTWKNIKSPIKNNKFKMSSSTWNETFELPEGLYSVSDIQDHFECIRKKHEKVTNDPSIRK